MAVKDKLKDKGKIKGKDEIVKGGAKPPKGGPPFPAKKKPGGKP